MAGGPPFIAFHLDAFALKAPFVISRGACTSSFVLTCEVRRGDVVGRGEAEADESDASVARRTLAAARRWAQGLASLPCRQSLRAALSASPLRNAVDCALWDLEAKEAGLRAWSLAALHDLDDDARIVICRTLSLDAPEVMAERAAALGGGGRLKVKLGDGVDRDIERVAAVRAASPHATISVDPNGGWTLAELRRFCDAVRALDLMFIEQPLSPGADAALEGFRSDVPLCADESFTTAASLAGLRGRYAWVNIKLDKTGGLTEALDCLALARASGRRVMTGCNLGTSLAMAPAFLPAWRSDFVDLDGPLLLARDREVVIPFDGDRIGAPPRELWG